MICQVALASIAGAEQEYREATEGRFRQFIEDRCGSTNSF